MFAVWKWLPIAVKTVIRVPLDVASRAKLGARNEAHGAAREIRGVVHRIMELDDLQRVDERAGVGVVGVDAEAEGQVPAPGREHGLVVRGAAGQDVIGGVDGGPEGAVDDEVEHGRGRRGGAVEEGGAEEVAAVGVDGERVAELGVGAVREGAEGGEGGVEEALDRERAGGAGGDVGAVGVPAEAAAVGGGARGAAVELVGEAAESLAGGEGEEEEEDGGGGGGAEERPHSGEPCCCRRILGGNGGELGWFRAGRVG